MNIVLTALLAAAIHVDQVGYASPAPKLAVVAGETTATHFAVVQNREVILEGTLSLPVHDANSGDVTRTADFSLITQPGSYDLIVAGEKKSFVVADRPYREVLRSVMHAYRDQRCGISCHREAAVFHPSSGREGTIQLHGGWHDAGDYGHYVVNSGITVGTLLWTHELFPDAVPGLLDEVRWNLEWMLSMQDRDGGVWHKRTSLEFPPFIAPQDDHSVQYVIGKGSCATADFAAVMAIAGRVHDGAFAKRATAAANRAWEWLERHPNVAFRNPPGVVTGEYGDDDCSDERLWAAAELWRSTGHQRAHAFFLRNVVEVDAEKPPDWKHLGELAAWTYAMNPRQGSDENAVRRIRGQSLEAADRIVERVSKDGYRIPLTADDYEWGSNAVAANYGVQLLIANRMRPHRAYIDAARDILHHLLGRNTFSLSFVTGAGTNRVRNPHHRPSAADGVAEPFPGLLIGGPNRNRQDDVLRALPADLPPAKVYADVEASYAGNEIAINWNAPLLFLLAGLEEK